jgi:hypothetical protein
MVQQIPAKNGDSRCCPGVILASWSGEDTHGPVKSGNPGPNWPGRLGMEVRREPTKTGTSRQWAERRTLRFAPTCYHCGLIFPTRRGSRPFSLR